VTDVRPLAGLALGFALTRVEGDVRSVYALAHFNWSQVIGPAIPLAVVFVLALLLRRRLRTIPPAHG